MPLPHCDAHPSFQLHTCGAALWSVYSNPRRPDQDLKVCANSACYHNQRHGRWLQVHGYTLAEAGDRLEPTDPAKEDLKARIGDRFPIDKWDPKLFRVVEVRNGREVLVFVRVAVVLRDPNAARNILDALRWRVLGRPFTNDTLAAYHIRALINTMAAKTAEAALEQEAEEHEKKRFETEVK